MPTYTTYQRVQIVVENRPTWCVIGYMAHTKGKISQFLKAIRDGLVQDIPPEYQACEACREATCSTERAATCPNRARGESQEKRRRRQALADKP